MTANSGGTVAPGVSPGQLTVGSVVFNSGSEFAVELAGVDFDQLLVTSTATLGGDLTIDLLGGFIPFAADSFTVLSAGTLSGSFSNVANGARLDTLAASASFLVSYDGTTDAVVLSDFAPSLDGDFDLNGVVDGFDFLKWQRGESPHPLSQLDLGEWKANYGMVASLSAASAAVPEPSTCVVLLCGMMTMLFRRNVVVS